MSDSAPVGIFDSGVGGLSVARQIRALLPGESLLYLADTAYCPYGGRPLDEIRARSLWVAHALVDRGAKVIVVACNTASGAALESLRAELPVPIVGLEPAVKPAAERTRSRRIAVLATAATLRSERFFRLTGTHARTVEVITRPCPGLVELVEEGETDGEAAERALAPILVPLREAGVDAVVLGCTHYPFLREAMSRILGSGVEILDSGAAVARQLQRVLRDRGALAACDAGGLRILTTGEPTSVARVVERLWGERLGVEQVRIGEDPTGS